MRWFAPAAAAVVPLLAASAAGGAISGDRLTILSAPAGGGAADGASGDPAISQDIRMARLVAFDTAATNLGGAAGGGSSVYVIRRKGPFGPNGDPWVATAPELVSGGMGGAAANGPSGLPALDGTSRVAPHCVAFVSAASNLVPGDTNGKPDAFVRDVDTGRTTRVSVNSQGRQSNGAVSEVAIDGLCSRVAFVSDASNLALTKTKNPSWKSAVTRAPPAGRDQVYVRAIGGATGLDRALHGLTFLASAVGRAPGNGNSFGVHLGNDGKSVVFASSASNLVRGDGNNTYDVYQRTMTRAYGRKVKGRRPQYLQMANRLISQASNGAVGSGPSIQPSVNANGTVVAYTTTAANIIGASVGANSQVVRAKVSSSGPPSTRVVSDGAGGRLGNGPSSAPVTNYGGTWVAYRTFASNIGRTTDSHAPDTNGVADVILWTETVNDHWLIGAKDATSHAGHPAMSAHGNYIVYERGGQVILAYIGSK